MSKKKEQQNQETKTSKIERDLVAMSKGTKPIESYRLIAYKYEASTRMVERIAQRMIQDGIIKPRPLQNSRYQKSARADLKPPVVVQNAAKERLKKILKRNNTYTLTEISNRLDIGIARVESLINMLSEEGHDIRIKDDVVKYGIPEPQNEPYYINVKRSTNSTYYFGALGDTHLGSHYERLDVLNAIYDFYEKEGITEVYHTGNWIEGEANFNKSDIHVHGFDNQIAYFVKNYPQRKGITTFYIDGDDHEGWYWQKNGTIPGKIAEMRARAAGRNDLVYLGYQEKDIIWKAKDGETKMKVMHPGGGSAYAISYTVQKIVEAFTPGEKPHILLAGHYHKGEHVLVRGVHCFQTLCVQDQSSFMRKKKLAAHVGAWAIKIGTDDRGAVTRTMGEMLTFYDKEYYRQWQHIEG